MGTIIISLFLGLAMWTPDLFGQEQVDAPKYKNGDFWVFRSNIGGSNPIKSSNDAIGDYELTRSDGKFKAFKIDGEQKSETTDNIGGIRAMLPVGTKEPYVEFPLSVGKKWDTKYQVSVRGSPVWVTSQIEVTKLEEIRTPAGTFRAFKIERSDISGKVIRWQRVYYYSPETGSIVKYHLETALGHEADIELVKFGPTR